MTGPRQELLTTGHLGAAGVGLLYETVRKVVRVRNLPPPAGQDQWTADALTEAAHTVFAERGGQRLLTLAARSTDEGSFRAALWTLVTNDLVSQGRRSERGRLSERLKSVIDEMGDIQATNGRFRLEQATDGDPVPVRYDELVTAAAEVAIRVPAWDPLSDRAAPIADRESLEAMIRAVLGRAGGGLTLGELVNVAAVRLAVHDAPDLVDDTRLDTAMGDGAWDPVIAVEGDEAARALLSQLTDDERRALPFLDGSAAEVAAALGLGKTKAWQVQRSARLKLASLLEDSPDGAYVLGRAVALLRTGGGGK